MLVFNAPREIQTITDSHGKAVIPIAASTPNVRCHLAVDLDHATIRGEYFLYPVTALIKPAGLIERDLYAIKLRVSFKTINY